MGYDGTAVGSITYAAGASGFGTELVLDGSAYVRVAAGPGPMDFHAGSTQTWEGVGSTTTNDGNLRCLISNYDNTTGWYILLGITGSKAFFRSADGSGTHQGTTTISDGSRHALRLTYDGATFKLYVDGVQEATATFAIGTSAGGGGYFGYIGGWAFTNANYWIGHIDEVRISGYVVASGNYTPATAPFADSGLETSLYHLNSNLTDSAVLQPATAYVATLGAGAVVGAPVTITLTGNGATSAVVTPHASGAAGSFSAATVTLNDRTPVATLTWTPTAQGAADLSFTNNGGLTNPSDLTYYALIVVPVDDPNWFRPPGVVKLNGSTFAANFLPGAGGKVGFIGPVARLDIDISHISSGYPTYRYSINDEAWQTVLFSGASTNMFNRAGLNVGGNVLEYVRVKEGRTNENWLTQADEVLVTGLSVQGMSASVAAIIRPGRGVVFGDSISAGLAVGATSSDDDWQLSYVPVLAAGLDAEVGTVGVGNWGWASTGAHGEPAFPAAWKYYYSGSARVFTALDWVWVNLGTNDGRGGVPDATITAAVLAWLVDARAVLGSLTKIFVQVPFGGFARTGIAAGVAAYRAAHTSDLGVHIIDLGTEGERGLTTLGTATQESNDGIHPNQLRSAQLGAMLVQAALPWLNSSIGSASHPDYSLTYVGPQLAYVGDNVPLRFSLKRVDGTTPDNPASAVVKVTLSNVSVATLTPDLDPAPASGTVLMAALWPTVAAGSYAVQAVATLASDGQVRSGVGWVAVR